MTTKDWTVDPKTGRSNSSPEFLHLARMVGGLIRNSAQSILAGDVEGVGRLIMAQLAHAHGMRLRRGSEPRRPWRRVAAPREPKEPVT